MVVALVVVVAGVILLQLLRLEVEVVDVAARGPARLPLVRQRRLQPLLRDVEQVAVLLHVHPQVLRVLLDLLLRRVVLLVQLLLHDLETLPQERLRLLDLRIDRL